MTHAELQGLQVDQNYDAFACLLDSILDDHRDQLALMRDGEIVAYFETPREALEAADMMFADQIWSIQKVTDEPLFLGFWSQ